MTRTYRRHFRAQNCCGSNTEYYRSRRKLMRRKANHEIRNLLAHHTSDEVSDLIKGPDMKYVNQWDEPTDGHWMMNKDYVKLNDKVNGYDKYYHRKTDHIFKPKHSYKRLRRK